MSRIHLALSSAALALALTATPTLAKTPPKPGPASAVLFWSQAQKETGFQAMEDHFAVNTVKRGKRVHPLPKGKPLDVSVDLGAGPVSLDDYMAREKAAGILVIQDGKIRLEKYALGYGPDRRWTTFSVAKSVTSTLVGAAIKDGYIKSIDDPVVQYIPGLKGSAYDKVSVRQILTMTSGVKWNEDYTDPKSDVAQLFTVVPDKGVDSTVSYMRKLPQEAAPGTKWVYKTGETNLIGVLVTSATGKTLAQYMSEKIWRPYGMEKDAVWMIDDRGQEAGGCCLSMAACASSCAAAPWPAASPSCRRTGSRTPPTSRPKPASPATAMAISGGPMTTAPMTATAFSASACTSTPPASWSSSPPAPGPKPPAQPAA